MGLFDFLAPDPPKAPKMDLVGDSAKYLEALQKTMPGLLGLERRYRDNFTGLNLRDTNQLLGGVNGQKGLVDLSRQYGRESADMIGDMRGRELHRMRGQSDDVRRLLGSVSPESAQMVRQSVEDANVAQRAATGLTGSEQRTAQQFAREGAADRGRTMDNSAMSAEVLNRDDILARKRAEAAQLSNNAFNMANQFYTQPGLQALYSTPQGYQAGQNMIGIGLSGIGSSRPQMVDPGMGFNLGAMNRNNQLNASMAGTNAQASTTAGLFGGIGSLLGGIF